MSEVPLEPTHADCSQIFESSLDLRGISPRESKRSFVRDVSGGVF